MRIIKSRIKVIISGIFILIFNSCKMPIESRVKGDKDLGNGYYFFENEAFSCIVYDNSPKYQNKGLQVIPYEVVKAEANSNYILAMTLNDDNTVNSYWIIDKKNKINLDDCYGQKSCDSVLRSNVLGPLDSITFFKEIENKDINLEGFEK